MVGHSPKVTHLTMKNFGSNELYLLTLNYSNKWKVSQRSKMGFKIQGIIFVHKLSDIIRENELAFLV